MKPQWYMRGILYCHVYEWLWVGFGLVIRFIEHLRIVTTGNYSAIANSHTVQFTTARSKSSQSAVPSPVVAWWRIPTKSSASILMFLSAGNWPTTVNSQLNSTDSRFYSDWLVTAAGPHYITSTLPLQKTPVPRVLLFVVLTSVGMPMWSLLSHCLATAVCRAIT
jgi:hypothetical protein